MWFYWMALSQYTWLGALREVYDKDAAKVDFLVAELMEDLEMVERGEWSG